MWLCQTSQAKAEVLFLFILRLLEQVKWFLMESVQRSLNLTLCGFLSFSNTSRFMVAAAVSGLREAKNSFSHFFTANVYHLTSLEEAQLSPQSRITMHYNITSCC